MKKIITTLLIIATAFVSLGAHAGISYKCNPGDTLIGTLCQPPNLIITATTNYACADVDQNGVTDQFIAGSGNLQCKPDLLSYTGEPNWYCPVVTAPISDPDPIVAGTATWSLNGSLQAATGYTVAGPIQLPGPTSHPIGSSKQWVGGTTCSYTPPNANAIFSFITYSCADPTYTLDPTGLYCLPPKTPSNSILSYVLACSGADSLLGSTCTPPLVSYSPAQTTTYACDAALVGASLIPSTGMCRMPMQTQPPTPVTTNTCGTNATLNAATGMCDYTAVPAINIGGQYTCPALYTVGTGSNAGWCMPTPQWAYPATWNLTKYDCPNGGTLGLLANGQPNGLCYLP